MNYAVDGQHHDAKDVVREFLHQNKLPRNLPRHHKWLPDPGIARPAARQNSYFDCNFASGGTSNRDVGWTWVSKAGP